MRPVLSLAFVLETLSIGIIQYMLNDAMNSELIYGSLKNISTTIHNTCLRFLELVHAHLKSFAPENVMRETIGTILSNRKGGVSEPAAAEAAIRENNSAIMKLINKIMKLKTGAKLFGYSSSAARAKQEKSIQNILSGVLRAIDTGATDLKLVRDSVRAIGKELPQAVVRQGPIALQCVRSPFLPALKEEAKGKTYTLVLDLDETLVHYCEVLNDSG